MKLKKIFNFLIFAFIISLPWQTRWIFFDYQLAGQVWEYGRLSIYASWLLLLVAAIIFLYQERQERRWQKPSLVYLLLSYSLVILIIAPLKVVSSYYLGLLFSGLLAAYLFTKANKKFLHLALVSAGFMQAILAIYQFFIQSIRANKWLGLASHQASDLGAAVIELGDQRWLRAYGSFTHPNVLGGFLALTILFSLNFWYQFYQQGEHEQWSKKYIKQTWWQLSLLITSLVSQSIALSLTFSRSAVLGLVLALLFILIFAIKNKLSLLINISLKYLFILILVIFLTNWYLPGAWQQRILGQGRLENISTQQRLASWQQINWSKPQQLIFGQGLGLNTYQFWQTDQQQKPFEVQPIHNVYLLILAELGLVGVLFLFYIFWRYFYRQYQSDYLGWGVLVLLAVIACFDHYLWTSWSGYLLISFLAMVYSKK